MSGETERRDAAARRTVVRDWLLSNGVLLAAILLGVWVILGLFRLNLSVREVGRFLADAPGELRRSTAAIADDLVQAELHAQELRRKAAQANAAMQHTVLKDRLAQAQESAYKMAEELELGLGSVRRTLSTLPTVQARVADASALAADAQATAAAGGAALRRTTQASVVLQATAQAQLVSAERELRELTAQLARLRANVARRAAEAAPVETRAAQARARR